MIGDVCRQRNDVNSACLQNNGGLAIICERKQQMLERGVLVAAFGGQRQRPVQSLFEVT